MHTIQPPGPIKGIVLAGGSGSRLRPATQVTSKQLLPVYDKPMVYYPISALMLAGIRDILVISTPHDLPDFQRLLGGGEQLGVRFSYLAQPAPEGLAQAFILGREFLDGCPACLVLGDSLFYGNDLGALLRAATSLRTGARIFAYRVADPRPYGVVEVDDDGAILSLEEKPLAPRSDWAVPGLYIYGPDVCERAARLAPSARGELEITDLNRVYLERGELTVQFMGRGVAWFDMGTPQSLLAAATFIATIQERQALMVGCLEEIALLNGWIDRPRLAAAADAMGGSNYAHYLRRLARDRA